MRLISVKLSDDTDDALERLASVRETTKSQIVREGIRLLATAQRESLVGRAIGIVQGDRVIKELCVGA